MARKRTRRPRVSWFPVFGRTIDTFPTTMRAVDTITEGDGEHTVAVVPLTWDWPFDENVATQQETSLADFIGSAYLIRRIVGKIFCNYLDSGAGPEEVVAGAGIFAARADETNPLIPMGYATGGQASYDPLNPFTMREPWIWRRTWILHSPANPGQVSNTRPPYPPGNAYYGSVLDGPHVDAKTRRFVNDDNRLFLALSSHANQIQAVDPSTVEWFFDLRMLGQLRRNRGTSTF